MFSRLAFAAALAATSGAALAADLPTAKGAPPAPYVAAPVFTWTGFYVGADIGGGWTNDSATTFNTGTGAQSRVTFGENASGILGGLLAGYNWQMNNIVIGVEGDIEATSLSANATTFTTLPGNVFLPAGNLTASQSLPWQGSLRARLGYAAGPALFYVTGGVALAQVNTSYTTLPTNTVPWAPGSTSFSSTRTGWTLGGGVEYAFNANWTLRAEYRYTNFGSFSDVIPVPAPIANAGWAGQTVRHSLSENAIRVGIAYKFGEAAAPVVAKY